VIPRPRKDIGSFTAGSPARERLTSRTLHTPVPAGRTIGAAAVWKSAGADGDDVTRRDELLREIAREESRLAALNAEIADTGARLAKLRNALILEDVSHALDEKRSPILLTERRDHLQYFADRLAGLTPNLVVLHGGVRAKARTEAIGYVPVEAPMRRQEDCDGGDETAHRCIGV